MSVHGINFNPSMERVKQRPFFLVHYISIERVMTRAGRPLEGGYNRSAIRA